MIESEPNGSFFNTLKTKAIVCFLGKSLYNRAQIFKCVASHSTNLS
ncbi:hypothetical protein VEA_001867 [Vibrio antiquarius]|uniref:Uncharacterized protein n=1 Tax=Vibrio antiquarius (strain Ex25) TaxID=150340 RepID=A0ACA6QI65_VIBAE|nr:hypothetical protein VEA_001867 [Vibrio antiquarius]CDT74005.1 conserved hypothetical protein [Vibrio diabolicus]